MSHATLPEKTKPVKRRLRGICKDAEALEVHRSTLWRVRTGRWKLKDLARRDAELQEQKRRNGK